MATPLINGINYNYANVKFIAFGVQLIGVTSIEYSSLVHAPAHCMHR